MSIEVSGIAHIQLSVKDPERCLPFWEKLCRFLGMKTLIKGEGVVYCIGGRTGILEAAFSLQHEATATHRLGNATLKLEGSSARLSFD